MSEYLYLLPIQIRLFSFTNKESFSFLFSYLYFLIFYQVDIELVSKVSEFLLYTLIDNPFYLNLENSNLHTNKKFK